MIDLNNDTKVNDSLKNVVANLGTQRDKAASSEYCFTEQTDDQLIQAYRGAWLPRAIVDIPAEDATRKWRAWKADPKQISKIEALEKRLGVSRRVEAALKMGRLLGGAALYISTNEKDPAKPLQPERIREIKGLPMLTKLDLTAGEINRDIESEYYGKPEFYKLKRSDGQGEVRIHASRLVIFDGHPVPVSGYAGYRDSPLQGGSSGVWGDSVLQSAMDAVLSHDSAVANIVSLIFEAKVDVLRFDGFSNLLECDQGAKATNRMVLMAAMKGINGALVMDKEDEYDSKSASFSGLDSLLERFGYLVAGAAEIPSTRLFGRSSAGLSGTGDGDERIYFDRIGHEQASKIEPAMHLLDECLIQVALGTRPPEIWYEWRPLRQVSEKERADIFKTTADAARALAGTMEGTLLPIEALSDSLVNELIEQGVLPGLELAIDEYGSLSEQELEREGGEDGATMADATPRTLYIRRNVLNAKDIIRWAKAQGFETTLPESDLHVTIAFSRQPVDWFKVGTSWSPKVEVSAGGPRAMEEFGEAKVLLFASPDLTWRHDEIREAGASWDHPEYQPHITISYGDAPDGVEPYQGPIILGPEIFEEVKDDWQESIVEA